MFLYKGKRLEEFSKEELIAIAIEGWTAYLTHLEQSRRAMRTLSDLHKAARL